MCQRGISPSRTPLVKPTRGRPTSAPTRTRNCIAAGQPVVCVNKGPNKGKDSACCNTGFASLLCRNVCGDRDDGKRSAENAGKHSATDDGKSMVGDEEKTYPVLLVMDDRKHSAED